MKRILSIAFFAANVLLLKAQEQPSYAEQLRQIERELDSISIFYFLDSVLSQDFRLSNEFNVRMSYTSSITAAGREFVPNQVGFAPGVSFYHRTGLFGDLSSFHDTGSELTYNPVILNVGYLTTKPSMLNFSVDFERWFYFSESETMDNFNNALSAGVSLQKGRFSLQADYSFLFGDAVAHRIIPTLSYQLRLGDFWKFKSITLHPSASLIAGNLDYIQMRVDQRELDERVVGSLLQIESFENLTENQNRFLRLLVTISARDGIISAEARNMLLRSLRESLPLTAANQAELATIAESQFSVSSVVDASVFNVLNYSLSIPLSLSFKQFNLFLSYTYTVPVKQENELVSIESLGYFGASLSYRIPIKSQ
ncbi:MAG: hypothetical protein AAF789_02765 [Bacteroidota bacterium]